MNPDILLDKLAPIAAGPGGVDRLRQIVINFALRGDLTLFERKEHSKSEDQSLLDDILHLRKQQWRDWKQERAISSPLLRKKNGAYKNPYEVITPPYTLPKGWRWVTVSQISFQDVGLAYRSEDFVENGIKLLRGENVKPGKIDWKNSEHYPPSLSTGSEQLFLNEGDIVLGMDRPIISSGLRIARISDQDLPCLLVQRVMRFRVVKKEMTDYLYLCLSDDRFSQSLSRSGMTGAQLPHITGDSVHRYPIPLPSLAEQHEIVEKVRRLMMLCDGLEARQRAEREERRRLRTASLSALEEAATADEAERAWAHVAGEFGRLVDTVEDVVELRKSVFQLAIKGRLGTRSESDEPANILLRHLIEQNPARKERQECAKKDDFSSLPALPSGWVWTYVHCVGAVRLGRQRAPEHHYGPFMRPYLRVANVYEDRIDTSDILEMNFTPSEYETYRLEYGDVLLNEGQSRELVGRPAIYRDEVPGACFQNTLVRFRPFKPILSEYALTVFRAYLHSGRFQKKSQQTVNIAHLSAGRFAAMRFPLPPLAEQHRIVEKINQMMALCDGLEAGIRARDAALEAFTAAACRAVLDGPALVAAPAAGSSSSSSCRFNSFASD